MPLFLALGKGQPSEFGDNLNEILSLGIIENSAHLWSFPPQSI
jgi:hypothetical protein